MQSFYSGIEGLEELLKKYKNPLIVHGRAFSTCNIKETVKKYKCVEFSEFAPNPLYEEVKEGIKAFNEYKCDSIISIGGGSAIDVAKCIKLYCYVCENENFLKSDKVDTGIDLIAVPTTAGTGSESTKHAVIYYQGEKQSISHESIIPKCVVFIPEILYGLSAYQKKCTMMDALCQAIESWWSINSNIESIHFSKEAIKLIMNCWRDYIVNKEQCDNYLEICKEMLIAANYSGRAINITTTTAAHAMSYKLTSLYGIPHGHAVALAMIEVWKYLKDNVDSSIDYRGSEHLLEVLSDISEYISYDNFIEMYKDLELADPTSSNLCEDLEVLSKSVNADRLNNFPVALSEETLYGMYKHMLMR